MLFISRTINMGSVFSIHKVYHEIIFVRHPVVLINVIYW